MYFIIIISLSTIVLVILINSTINIYSFNALKFLFYMLSQVWSIYQERDIMLHIALCAKAFFICKGFYHLWLVILIFIFVCEGLSGCPYAINLWREWFDNVSFSWFSLHFSCTISPLYWGETINDINVWQLRILSLLKGVGGQVMHVKDMESFLSELLRRCSQHHFELHEPYQKLSKIEVEILCLLLEVDRSILYLLSFISFYNFAHKSTSFSKY